MEAAASAAPDVHTENGVEHSNASRTLRPLLKAVEMVFGSAAALSATFGYRVRSLLWRITTYQAPLQIAMRQGPLSEVLYAQARAGFALPGSKSRPRTVPVWPALSC